jgi:hypothetical protein
MTDNDMLAIALGIKPGKVTTVKIEKLTDEEKAAKAEASHVAYEARQDAYMEKHMADLAIKRIESGSELDRISRLRSEFPDLRVNVDRWKHTRYMAKSANSRVTDVEIRRTCGCCHDPGILAMPYMETTLGRVYSDPFHIEIGEGRSYDPVHEHDDWESRYRKYDIPEEVIGQMRVYMDAELARSEDDD